MKLVVNVGVLRHPMTGVGRYVLNLLQQIDRHPDVQDIVGLTLTGFVKRSQLRQLMQQLDQPAPPKTGLQRRLFAWAAQLPAARFMQLLWIKLLVLLNRHHYRQYIYWETSGALLPFQGPVISTVYDLSHLAFPAFHPPTRVRELNRRIPQYLQRSSRLLTISGFTKSQLLQHYPVRIPIDVVPPAVASEYFQVTPARQQAVRKRYNLPSAFVLAVATLEPRKNLPRLLQAYSRLPGPLQAAFPLLLAGAPGWLSGEPPAHQARYLGYVSQADLPALVSLASLNVYLSLYEGYGMPIAESMAVGTPVLCSNVTSMPEVAQNTCFMADPENVDSIEQTLLALLESDSLRTSRLQAARRVAAEYTWPGSASLLIQILRALQP